MNPFQRLYDKCNGGSPEDKYANLPEFPTHIDLELTNTCNFRCLMCPTGNRSMKRPSGFMDENVYYKIVAECSDYGAGLRFIGWGEPLLHPRIIEFVRAATGAGLLTHLNTNGSKLSDFTAMELIGAGLSSIKLSFQGVDRKTFAEMRNTDFFDDLVETVRAVHWIRGKKTSPFIQVSTSVTYETEDEVMAFRDSVGPYADYVSVGRTIFDFFDTGAVRMKPEEVESLKRLSGLATREKRHPDPCPEVYDKLSIHWDGSTMVCCNAFDHTGKIGMFPDQPLKELWRGQLIEQYRERLAKKEYSGPLCSQCFHYMEGTA